MADGFDGIDQVHAFAADMRRAPAAARRDTRAVLEKGGVNMKRQLREEMQRSRHFAQVASAISYEVVDRVDSIEVEVGAVSGIGGVGSLAHIAYLGTSRGGGTVPDPQGALDAEIPNVERYLADVMERWIGR